jgi:hypothetical protein
MSLRDVTKYLANPIVDKPHSVTAPLPITVTNALPAAELAITVRDLQWALQGCAESLRLNGVRQEYIDAALLHVRSKCSDLRKQFPMMQPVTNPVSLEADPLAVDPLTLL